MKHGTDRHQEGRGAEWLVLVALAFATSVCMALLGLRIVKTRHLTHAWLAWNLFLAWLPVVSATFASRLVRQRRWSSWAGALPLALLWLLFFPNAPYLLTDLIHLRPHGAVSIWYDVLLMGTCVWTGVLLGVVSLRQMQIVVGEVLGFAASWLFVLIVTGLTGVGVYLGRFLRWNSWDVIADPFLLLWIVWEGLRDPLSHVQKVGFAGMFALCFLAVYVSVVGVAHLQRGRAAR